MTLFWARVSLPMDEALLSLVLVVILAGGEARGWAG